MSVTAHDIIDYVTRITSEDMAWLEDIKQQVHEVMTSAKAPESTERTPVRGSVDLPAGRENACTGRSGAGKWHLVIPGRLPGLNEYIEAERRNRFKAAKLKAEAQDWVILCIKKYMRGVHITRPVYIKYYWYEPNRRRDKSNVSGYGRKVIEDALVQAGVLSDDGWDEITGYEDRFMLDKDNPRIVLEIIEEPTTLDADDTRKTARAGRANATTTGAGPSSGAATSTDGPAPKRRNRAKTTRRKG